jgi:GntR family transcriptional repressor for pyruvate dehydrogenase complex
VRHATIPNVNLSDSWTAGQHQIVRVSAAEAIFETLRRAIESGELKVGTRLSSETLLAQQYGVSRSVVREALRSTTALGLTSTQTGRGTFVIAGRVARDMVLGNFSARELSEARVHIEVPAAQLAAQRRSANDVMILQGIVESMATEDDPQVWVHLDGSFHAEIARSSGNGVFAQVVTGIREAMANQSETLNLVANRMPQSDEEHQAIYSAIAEGSAVNAGEAMRIHLSAVNEALESIFGAEDRKGPHAAS